MHVKEKGPIVDVRVEQPVVESVEQEQPEIRERTLEKDVTFQKEEESFVNDASLLS